MKKKFKTLSRRKLKFLGILISVIFIVTIPFCCNWFRDGNYYIISEEDFDLITNTEYTGIMVEFRCNNDNFAEVLSNFVKKHEELSLQRIETIDDNKDPKFIVTFIQK